MKQCFLLDFVKENIDYTLQLAKKHIGYYDFADKTKCLNTAVAVLTMYLGDRAKQYTRSCDVQEVAKRANDLKEYLQKKNEFLIINHNSLLVKTFIKDFFSDRSERYLYYVMITDAWVDTDPKSTTILFPGHVFVIEKHVYRRKDQTKAFNYKLYQSYITYYDLQGHYQQNSNSFRVSKDKLFGFFKALDTMYETGIWSDELSKHWQAVTHVDEKRFNGYVFKDVCNFCYKRIPISQCTSTFIDMVKNELKQSTSESERSRHALILKSAKSIIKTDDGL
jgi:hypothetical protein